MDWVKLGVRYYLDPAIRGMDGDLGDAAEVMFTRGLARAGEVGHDGFIPERDVPLLARRRRYEAVVSLLLRSGLWTDAPGGYRIVRWSDWQDHLDALTRKRAADRERQRARRAAERQQAVRAHGDQCRRCGTTDNLVVDHIIPLSRDGKDVDDNKQLLCWSCNARKRNLTEQEYDEWLRQWGYPPPNPTPRSKANHGVTLSRDGLVSRDGLRDVAEGEGEGEGVKGGDPGYGPQSPDTPPPRTCPKHTNDPNPPNCGPCKDARLAWEQHRADRARQRALDTANAPRCPRHRGQPAGNCAPCRAEQLAADREDRA